MAVRGGNREFVVGEAGDVPAWTRQIADKPLLDRIGDTGKHGRDTTARLLRYRQGRGRLGEDHVRLKLQELGGIGSQALDVGCRPSVLDLKVGANLPSQL